MSTEKKVFFLFVLFIILNVACVYNHTQGLEKDEPNVSQDKEIIEKTEEENTASEVVQKETTEEDKSLETKTDENLENTQEESTNEPNKESEVTQIEKVEEEIKEEVVQEPLLTADKRYKREDNQKYIEELSIKTQELQIEINKFVKKSPIIFKSGSDKIRKRSNISIKKIAKILKDNPNLKIEVAGHTDAAGPEKLNLIISQQRAVSVKNRLAYYGIEKNRIVARGYGETIPLIKKEGYSILNRRVEFNILEE